MISRKSERGAGAPTARISIQTFVQPSDAVRKRQASCVGRKSLIPAQPSFLQGDYARQVETGTSPCGSLPTQADRDRLNVGRDAAVFSVDPAKLGVEFDLGTELARDASPEIPPELILAGMQEVAVNWQ